jgi:predicted nucleic acid-binding protein
VDASALLAAWLPQERLQAYADALVEAHVQERVRLCAPSLLEHEVLNAFYIATRGKAGMASRLSVENAEEAWTLFTGLGIALMSVAEFGPRVLELAVTYRRSSSYDMAYVALAERLGTMLITADQRLINAVGPKLPFVRPLWETRL